MDNNFDTISFKRIMERNEGAFSLLVPDGWIMEGGILRVNPMMMGGPAQSLGAKTDLAIKKDQEGTVMIRWVPEYTYYDARAMGFGLGAMYPPGSNYNGMVVMPMMPAANFLGDMVFRQAHPYASDFALIEARPLPQVTQMYMQAAAAKGMMLRYDASVLEYRYDEHGIIYKEIAYTCIEDLTPMGGTGIWYNKDTVYMRAPLREFRKWEKVLRVIHRSGEINPQWMAMEIRGQIQRGEMAVRHMHDMQRIEREIVEHRRKTNAEINNDMFLAIMGQEEYRNPFTGDIEQDTNEWQHRWVAPDGAIIYTDLEDYNPNYDTRLNKSDFEKSKVKERFQG